MPTSSQAMYSSSRLSAITSASMAAAKSECTAKNQVKRGSWAM